MNWVMDGASHGIVLYFITRRDHQQLDVSLKHITLTPSNFFVQRTIRFRSKPFHFQPHGFAISSQCNR